MTELRAIAASRPERTRPITGLSVTALLWLLVAFVGAAVPAGMGEAWAREAPAVQTPDPGEPPLAVVAEGDRSFFELSDVVSSPPAGGETGDDFLVGPTHALSHTGAGDGGPAFPAPRARVGRLTLGFTSRAPPAAVL